LLWSKGKKAKKVAGNCELPCDVLDIISKTLDFDDLVRFAVVCKNWRAFYWRNFRESQEPLLLQVSYNRGASYSFISLPEQKIYFLKMMNLNCYVYVTSSSGYFIMAGFNNSFLLINPFTRRIKKVIPPSTFKVIPDFFITTPCLLLANAPKNLSWCFHSKVLGDCMSTNLEIVVGFLIRQWKILGGLLTLWFCII